MQNNESTTSTIKKSIILSANNNNNNVSQQCLICYENINNLNKFQTNFNSVDHNICVSCFAEFLKNEIINGNVQNLKCPHCEMALT